MYQIMKFRQKSFYKPVTTTICACFLVYCLVIWTVPNEEEQMLNRIFGLPNDPLDQDDPSLINYVRGSLELERRGWSGLLVEVDKEMMVKLREKNRKAWTAHACLATKPYPHTATLMKMSKRKSDPGMSVEIKALSALSDTRDVERRQQSGNQHYVNVQCYPLYTLLKACGVNKVDLISLDVEDVEVSVLENFPFEKMPVDVWVVEHRHPEAHVFESIGEDKLFTEWFTSRGFSLYKYYKNDYIFIRNGSPVHNRTYKNDKDVPD